MVWLKGMASRNMRFTAFVARFKCLEGQRRYVFPPSQLCNDASYYDAYTRAPDLAIFVPTDRWTKPIALPLAHVCGVKSI